jgi:hypothetical protein
MARILRIPLTKHRNVPTEYKGRLYHSKLEAKHAAHLDLMKSARNANKVLRWEPQVRVPLVVNGKPICAYVVDFRVVYADGREEWHEVKGRALPLGTLKMRLFEAIYPKRKLVVIK